MAPLKFIQAETQSHDSGSPKSSLLHEDAEKNGKTWDQKMTTEVRKYLYQRKLKPDFIYIIMNLQGDYC